MASENSSGPCEGVILLAEDEPAIRNLLRRCLEKAGFCALIAADADEALRLASEHPARIDLLISDIQMPGMSGLDLAKTLRRLEPGMRVMLMSAYPAGMLVLDSGWSFLRKPFLPNAFIEKVREILAEPPDRSHFAGRG